MWWKTKKDLSDKQQMNPILLGMIMLQNNDSLNFDAFTKDYNDNYDSAIEDFTCDNLSAGFTISKETIAIGSIPIPIPSNDLENTAQYAYNWRSVLVDVKDHTNHLLVTLLGNGTDQIKRFKILTQVICSLLRTTDSIGVYLGSQSLVIPKQDYLAEAELMGDDYLPLNLWIYFGLGCNEIGNFGYTYGLKEFNKKELEIINSIKNHDDIRSFLFNIAHYVLDYNVDFKDGQTCGLSADEKIPITLSKGFSIEGDTLKLAY